MKKRSFKDLFAELEGEPESKEKSGAAEKHAVSAAERVGRALLDRLGSASGLSEDALADAIIAVWEDPEALTGGEAEGNGKGGALKPYVEPEMKIFGSDASAADLLEGESRPLPFTEHKRTSAPIRSGGIQAEPIDYEELTDEQFRRLKKQLQKAAADGKRVRL